MTEWEIRYWLLEKGTNEPAKSNGGITGAFYYPVHQNVSKETKDSIYLSQYDDYYWIEKLVQIGSKTN